MTNRNRLFFIFLVLLGTFLILWYIVQQTIQYEGRQDAATPVVEQHGMIPDRIEIPAISVAAHVQSVGLEPGTKRMASPTDAAEVGWYALGYTPGELGSSVMDGHYDQRNGKPAVFYKLDTLKPNDLILVYSQGKRLRYAVTEVQRYPWDLLPLDRIFNTAGVASLQLITCGGEWDTGSQRYNKRIVVYSLLTEGGE
jgi:sortase A